MVSLLRDFYDKFRHKKTTIKWFKLSMVEREGFEPSIELQTLYSLSRGAPSATRTPLQRITVCIDGDKKATN